MQSHRKILVTGANGQLGQVLTSELRKKYGTNSVIATDIKRLDDDQELFEFVDILNKHRLYEIVNDYKITEVYHLAAILSASGEKNIKKTCFLVFHFEITLTLCIINLILLIMSQGKVKFFNESKGYGFIREDETNNEYFVHVSGLIDEVKDDDAVEFDLVEGRKGLNAVNVKVLS